MSDIDLERLLAQMERADMLRAGEVRNMLLAAGRPDLVEEFDNKMRDIRLGLDGARNCWHSISNAQRRALSMMADGPLERRSMKPSRYVVRDNFACRLATARALCAHELVAPDGGAFDPERRFAITERGLFVLRHGRKAAA